MVARTEPSERSRKGLGGLLAGVLAGAVLVLAVVDPRGDFPLSDDWSYAHAVRALCVEGELHMLPWTGASMVLQAWYGALLCTLLGFSFDVLRASTLVLAVSGAIGFALVLREAGVGPSASVLALVTLALSPLYVNLSFTFMTDVPFTALSIWAAWFYLRGLGRGADSDLIVGALICSAALLVRQHGIFVAAAASLACLWPGMAAREERLRPALAAGLLPALTFVAFHVWLFAIHGAPAGVQNKVAEVGGLSLLGFGNVGFRAVEYMGLLLLPVAVALAGAVWAGRRRVAATTGIALGAVALFVYARDGELMFYLTNVLYDTGLGALSLRDTLFLGETAPLHLGAGLGLVLTVLSTAAACTLVGAWSSGATALRTAPRAFVLFAFLLLATGSFLHVAFYFDRYLLPVMPFAIVSAFLCVPVRRVGPAPWIAALVLAWWAVAGTHDYMAWNRARYAGIETLERGGVDVREIDGGVEHNAWRLAAKLGTWPTKEEARPGQPATRKSWWWVVDDRFVVSFRPLAGYEVREKLSYRRWLVPGAGYVLVLERSR